MGSEERLQKVLAAAGLGSRRRCEDIISAGRVSVNGRTASLGDRVDPERDEISVDGVPIDPMVEKKYILLNKPPGYVTTVRDTRGRPTVMDLVKGEGMVFPVGRLDLETRGLLLLTNDGYLAHRVMHPSYAIDKTYMVTVEGRLGRRGLAQLREGVPLEEGVTAPARVRVLENQGGRCVLEMTIHEGRKRQVRRMCAAVGLRVTDLVRIRLGHLDLKGVEEGNYRALSREEVEPFLE